MGRPRWKLSFQSRSPSAASPPSASPSSSVSAEMPVEFLCPISGSLMADPVIVPSGHTFERSCIQACAELAFTPPSLHPALDLSSRQRQPLVLIPNNALKSAIVSWCERLGLPPPLPIPRDAALSLVQRLMPSAPVLPASASGRPGGEKGNAFQNLAIYNGEGREVNDEVWRAPQFAYGGKEGRRPAAVAGAPASDYDLDDEKSETFLPSAFRDGGRNEQGGILRRNSKETTGRNNPPALSVRTKKKIPSLLSTSSSSSSYQSSSSYTSSEIVADDNLNQEQQQPSPPSPPPRVIAPNLPASKHIPTSPVHDLDGLEEDILNRVRGMEDSEQESAAAALRQASRESPEHRKRLCTPRLLAAVRSMLLSGSATVQINAAAAMVNLSLEPANKVLIVRSGAVPPLIDVLKNGHPEARDHAAGALFSLTLEEENRLAVGVLGAIQPLLAMFTRRDAVGASTRRDAGMAVYYLSLATTNRSKIAHINGAARALLSVAAERDGRLPPTEPQQGPNLSRLAMMIICNLAGSTEGRAALMDAGAVEAVLRLMKVTPEAEEEYCVAALYGMSKGSLRFRGLARAAGAERMLMRVAEGAGGEVRREMAKKTLRTMRGENDEDGAISRPPPLTGLLSDEDGSVVSEGLMAFPRRYKDYGNVSAEF